MSSPPFPKATKYPNLEFYASACACINAVDSASTITSKVYETTSTRFESVVESIVTVVESTVIVEAATTTTTATLDMAISSLATVTTTVTPVAPAQTAYLTLVDGARAGKPADVLSSYVVWATSGPGSKIAVSVNSKSPWLAGQPTVIRCLHISNA